MRLSPEEAAWLAIMQRLAGRPFMRKQLWIVVIAAANAASVQAPSDLANVSQLRDYALKRSSSYDRTGGNADARQVAAGGSITVLDEDGPGQISHIWFTIADKEEKHLKKIVLRMYWDGESSPSVEAPIGDFFGLGTGDYFLYQSDPTGGRGR
jgi:hypothetical protein